VTDSCRGAWVVVSNKAPFHIEKVSEGWAQVLALPQSAFLGRSLRVLQGPDTDMCAVSKLMNCVQRGVAAHGSFVSYNADGKRLWTHLWTEPLLSCSGSIDSFLAHGRFFQTIGMQEAMSAHHTYSLIVEVEGTHKIVHASPKLCQQVGHSFAAGECEALCEDPVNRQTLARLEAELVDGERHLEAAHVLRLQTSHGSLVSFACCVHASHALLSCSLALLPASAEGLRILVQCWRLSCIG
jgi:hypothetical protein